MNRYIKTWIYLTAVCAVLVSCQKRDFLAPVPLTNALDVQKVFSDSTNTDKYLAQCYADLWGGLDEFTQATNFIQISDEGEGGADFLGSNGFNNGILTSTNFLDNAYNTMYTRIRRTNVLLGNRHRMSFLSKARVSGEAQFLRAYYYSELVKRFGGVPLETSPVTFDDISDAGAQAEYKARGKRATFKASIDFIVGQLDSAAAVLPWYPVTDAERGRATAAAAVGLKARVLLMAASKLFNNNQPAPAGEPGSMTNELIGYTDYDINRWKLAADACKEFLLKNANNGNWYTLYNDFNRLTTESRDPANHELIFYRQTVLTGTAANFNTFYDPYGRIGGNGYILINVNLVDKFEMTNGKAINEVGSGYNEQQWWVNRDPRLAATVIKNGDTWKGFTMELWPASSTSTQGRDYDARNRTGLFIRKFRRQDGNSALQKWHYLRFAEIYLMLAEAENELNGPANAYSSINIVRARPGVGMPAVSGLNQAQMREKIRNERAVELALESHRYFDVRRWMIAEVVDNAPMYGFNVTRNGTTVIHTRYAFETRIFHKRMYLYPFPLTELYKGVSIEQNPGY